MGRTVGGHQEARQATQYFYSTQLPQLHQHYLRVCACGADDVTVHYSIHPSVNIYSLPHARSTEKAQCVVFTRPIYAHIRRVETARSRIASLNGDRPSIDTDEGDVLVEESTVLSLSCSQQLQIRASTCASTAASRYLVMDRIRHAVHGVLSNKAIAMQYQLICSSICFYISYLSWKVAA